jgi:predicted secreted Zn-dependent protease
MGSDRHSGAARAHEPRRTLPSRAPATRGPDSLTLEHGFAVAPNAATVNTLLAGADRGTRERFIAALQRMHGNAAVQRLIAGGVPVQRWAVGLPKGTSDCAVVVSYMNAHSPYRATSGWARTRAQFSWGGDPAYAEADGVITATVANPTVTRTVTVDMPTWAPTDPAMARAWSAMITDLRAHEARHEGIATVCLSGCLRSAQDLGLRRARAVRPKVGAASGSRRATPPGAGRTLRRPTR